MRWLKLVSVFIFAVAFGFSMEASEARIIKVLPHYLDIKGRHTLSPSLYERDAYQSYLRQHKEQRSALRFDIQWKGKTVNLSQAKLRIELRGVKENSIQHYTLEQPASKKGMFSNWSSPKIEGEDYKNFGELVAWRATLWEGDKQLAEQKSFLW